MSDNQNKAISGFVSGYYNDGFYGDGSRIKKDKKQERFIFEFHFLKFIRYLIYESIFVGVVYFVATNRYINAFVFILGRILVFNGIAWIIGGAILLLMLYESIEIRKIKTTQAFMKESSKIDRLL